MKNILIACDSFKESMSAFEACHAIERGIKKSCPSINTYIIPMADGGEGTCDVLANTIDGKTITIDVCGPLMQRVQASYIYDKKNRIAIMEVAEACGLHLVPDNLRNPLKTTTYGVGEMIKDAIKKGAKSIYIGLGGSATNDGGLGMLNALGAKFTDENNVEIREVEQLNKLQNIDLYDVFSLIHKTQITILSDVNNPFIGENGATYVFSKQKGATLHQRDILEHCLKQYNEIVKKQYSIDLSVVQKTGAAGGLGGAFYLLNANMTNGIDTVLKMTDFENYVQKCDFILTGEGSIDFQTINGKTISGILNIAKKYHKPVIAFAGRVTQDIDELYEAGLTACFSITNEAKSLECALKDGKLSLEHTSFNVYQIIKSIFC